MASQEVLLYHCIQNCSGQKINYAAVGAAMGITSNAAGKRYNAFKQKFDPTKMSKEEVLLYYCVQNVNGTKVNYNGVGAAMGITGNAAGKRYNALKQKFEAHQSKLAMPSISTASTNAAKGAVLSKSRNKKYKIKDEYEPEVSEDEKRKDLQAVFDEKREELQARFRAEEAEDERLMFYGSEEEVTTASDAEAITKQVANQGKKRKAAYDSEESEMSMSEEESEDEDEDSNDFSPPPSTRQTRGRNIDLRAVFETGSSDEESEESEDESESDDYKNNPSISMSQKNKDIANKHANDISVKYIDRSLKNLNRSSLKNEIARANASRAQTKTVLPPTPQSNVKASGAYNTQPVTPASPSARATKQTSTPAPSIAELLDAALAQSDLSMARQAKSVEMRFAQSPTYNRNNFTPINKRDVPLPSVEKDDEKVTPERVSSETRSLSSISYPPRRYFHDEDEDMYVDGGSGATDAERKEAATQAAKSWLDRFTGGLFSGKTE